jgi:hypothetical protein
MEKVGGVKSGADVVRRTAALKVMIGFLYRELESSKGADSVALSRELFESVITTLECTVEDIELRAGARTDTRPTVVDAAVRGATVRA